MLPTPVSSGSRRPFRRNNGALKRSIDTLLSRTRITNLAVLLLSLFTLVSFFYNVSYYFSRRPIHWQASSVAATISRAKTIEKLVHLVIVPGHAIWTGSDASSRLNEDDWVLEPYQREGGRVETFFQQIARGASIALRDERALLVFSGGQTRASSIMTEAESYLRLALSANVFNDRVPSSSSSPPLFSRATTENYALDSFQNLLFSVARFHEYVGRYPSHITVVGYGIKEARFRELHREAIHWPAHAFDYIGIDPPPADNVHVKLEDGERQNGYIPYSKDVYGCHSELLDKRRARNPYSRFHSYFTSSPELAELLEYCPSDRTKLFEGSLPWS